MFKLIVVCAIAAVIGSYHGGLIGGLVGVSVSLVWSYAQGFYEAWRADRRPK